MKTWLNWSNSGPPTKLFHNGKLIGSPADIAGTMNSFFLEKVADLRQNIPESNSDPLARLKEVMEDRQCTFSCSPVTQEEVMKVIKSLKNSKSTGIDHIDTFVMKLVATDVVGPLTHIVNMSIAKSTFPTPWKHAKVPRLCPC